ncbi:hypothetical protein MTO96_052337 [Rhipicephalus appendiculatus]
MDERDFVEVPVGKPRETVLASGTFADDKRTLLDVMAGRKRGPYFKDPDQLRRKNSRLSVVDRARIVDGNRRGGDIRQLAYALGINIKTSRWITATDREASKHSGVSERKFGDDVVSTLRRRVDANCTFTLRQIMEALEEEMPGVTISASTIDRLLDAHSHSVKLVTQRPADRNHDDVKHSRKLYSKWLQSNDVGVPGHSFNGSSTAQQNSSENTFYQA